MTVSAAKSRAYAPQYIRRRTRVQPHSLPPLSKNPGIVAPVSRRRRALLRTREAKIECAVSPFRAFGSECIDGPDRTFRMFFHVVCFRVECFRLLSFPLDPALSGFAEERAVRAMCHCDGTRWSAPAPGRFPDVSCAARFGWTFKSRKKNFIAPAPCGALCSAVCRCRSCKWRRLPRAIDTDRRYAIDPQLCGRRAV